MTTARATADVMTRPDSAASYASTISATQKKCAFPYRNSSTTYPPTSRRAKEQQIAMSR